MRAVVRGMWGYAVANEYVDTDITQHLIFEHTDSTTPIHTRFTDKEIKFLWDNLWTINNVDIVLIYIYTGCRPVELLEIKSEDVHLKERYMIGGVKTEAGKTGLFQFTNQLYRLWSIGFLKTATILLQTNTETNILEQFIIIATGTLVCKD